MSGEALGWVRQRSHGPRSSPRRSTHGSAPAPGHPDVPLDSRRGSDDDVGARDDALPDDVASGDYSGAAARMITWIGTLSDGRGLYLQTRTPREAPSAGSGEWDHKQALSPTATSPHTAQTAAKPALVTPAGRLPGRPNSPSRTPHGPPRPVRRPECRPTPARRPRPASAHSERLHRRQRAERAALSSRHTGPWPHAREAAHNLSRDAPPASQQLARHPQSAAAAPSPHWRGSPGR